MPPSRTESFAFPEDATGSVIYDLSCLCVLVLAWVLVLIFLFPTFFGQAFFPGRRDTQGEPGYPITIRASNIFPWKYLVPMEAQAISVPEWLSIYHFDVSTA